MQLRCATHDPGTTTIGDFKSLFSGAPKCTVAGGGRRSSTNTELTVSVKTYSDAKAKEGDAALKKAVEDKTFASKMSTAIPGSTISAVELSYHGTGSTNSAVGAKASAGGKGSKGGKGGKGGNAGLVVGLVIGLLCLLCLAAAAYYFLVVKKKPALSKQDANDGEKPSHVELNEVEEGKEGTATTSDSTTDDTPTKTYPDTNA